MLDRIAAILYRINGLRNTFSYKEDVKVLHGKILAQQNRGRTAEIIEDLHEAEFKVFSEWGDDGIIQFLTGYLQIKEKTFIEFGVDNYQQANTRFLLINNNWRGLIMDSSRLNMKGVRSEKIYWKYNLSAVDTFVTRENINALIRENGFEGDTGLLHIDIDGNDYWIWKEISVIQPVIVIMEYNSVFGCEHPWTIPYTADFNRTKYHYSNLYFGSSLLSLCDLAAEKGYCFIGCNSNGNNAYFVRKDRMNGLKPLQAGEGYVVSQFKESRNRKGRFTFLTGAARLQEISGMEVYNTRTGTIEKIQA